MPEEFCLHAVLYWEAMSIFLSENFCMHSVCIVRPCLYFCLNWRSMYLFLSEGFCFHSVCIGGPCLYFCLRVPVCILSELGVHVYISVRGFLFAFCLYWGSMFIFTSEDFCLHSVCIWRPCLYSCLRVSAFILSVLGVQVYVSV